MKKILLLLLLQLCNLNAQSLNDLYKQSMGAYESRDYKTFLELNTKMDSIRPMHPSVSYNLALAYSLNGDQENAFRILRRIALADNGTTIDTDADFAPFLKTEYYNDFQRLRSELSAPITNSKKVITLNEKTLHPEGMVYINGHGWLAASIRKRKITAFDIKTGSCTDWLAVKDMLAVFSLKGSGDGKYVWAATAAIPEMEGYDASLEGKAEVLKIDVASKTIVKRFTIPGSHVFGDLIVTDSGVYVSDSATPILYKIEGDIMSEWLNLEKKAYNLQGIITDGKGRLFVADYLKGILAVSLKDRSHHWLAMPEGTTQKGIDGLTYHNKSLIAIHNGVTPIRIIKYRLNEKHDGFAGFEVIDHNRKEFNEPVLGTIHKDIFYFFGNSPWKAYDKGFNLNEDMLSNPQLYACPLKNNLSLSN